MKVYLYLARTVEHKASEISEALSPPPNRNLQNPARSRKRAHILCFRETFKVYCNALEKALDILIETKRMKLNLLEKKRQNLVNIWLSLPKPEVELDRKEVFQILELEEQISLKAD